MEEHNNRRYYRDDMLEEEVIMARKTGYAATSVMNENEIILYSHPCDYWREFLKTMNLCLDRLSPNSLNFKQIS